MIVGQLMMIIPILFYNFTHIKATFPLVVVDWESILRRDFPWHILGEAQEPRPNDSTTVSMRIGTELPKNQLVVIQTVLGHLKGSPTRQKLFAQRHIPTLSDILFQKIVCNEELSVEFLDQILFSRPARSAWRRQQWASLSPDMAERLPSLLLSEVSEEYLDLVPSLTAEILHSRQLVVNMAERFILSPELKFEDLFNVNTSVETFESLDSELVGWRTSAASSIETRQLNEKFVTILAVDHKVLRKLKTSNLVLLLDQFHSTSQFIMQSLHRRPLIESTAMLIRLIARFEQIVMEVTCRCISEQDPSITTIDIDDHFTTFTTSYYPYTEKLDQLLTFHNTQYYNLDCPKFLAALEAWFKFRGHLTFEIIGKVSKPKNEIPNTFALPILHALHTPSDDLQAFFERLGQLEQMESHVARIEQFNANIDLAITKALSQRKATLNLERDISFLLAFNENSMLRRQLDCPELSIEQHMCLVYRRLLASRYMSTIAGLRKDSTFRRMVMKLASTGSIIPCSIYY